MTSKKTARGEKCHHGGKNGGVTRKDRGHLAKGCRKAEMCNFWVVEPVSCWDPHFTGISRLSHQKHSCTSHQRNIPPMQFLDCLIRSPRMPRKKLSYSPHQKNIPSMLEFLQYPFKRFFVHLTKNLLMHIEMHRLPHPNSSIT